jgi:hypothetical protein
MVPAKTVELEGPLMSVFRCSSISYASMSADNVRFGSLAEIEGHPSDVRFTPKADIAERDRHVHFVPKADIASFDHLVGGIQ